MTIAEFIEKAELSIESLPSHSNPNGFDDESEQHHWSCRLSREGNAQKFTTFFSQGDAHRVWKMPNVNVSCGHRGNQVGKRYTGWMPHSLGRGTATVADVEQYEQCSEPAPPKLDDLLDCLASDASGMDELFTDWAENLGYSCDSIKALTTYQVCQRQSRALRIFLGHDLFHTLLNDVERL